MLPLPVLEEAQRDLIALPGVGMSVMEISHRSKAFEDILNTAIANIRQLANVPANYKVLMLQGGASLQFSMVPMNLLTPGATADYIDSGSWADKAIKEAKRVGTVNVAASTKGENYARLPEATELKLTPGAAYVHMTSNNTIEGTQSKTLPAVGDAPLVSDMSSDIFSRKIDVSKYGLIYAGAQKNLGPSGVTVVIVREDLLQRPDVPLGDALDRALRDEGQGDRPVARADEELVAVRADRKGPRPGDREGRHQIAALQVEDPDLAPGRDVEPVAGTAGRESRIIPARLDHARKDRDGQLARRGDPVVGEEDDPGRHRVLREVRVGELVDRMGLVVAPVLEELSRGPRVVDLVEVHLVGELEPVDPEAPDGERDDEEECERQAFRQWAPRGWANAPEW